jgi:RNA polymerase sigma factor (sigma-70 family)
VRIVPDDPPVSDLVDRAQKGDDAAWSGLVHRYGALVWAICRRSGLRNTDCEDVSQTVWLRLVEALPRLREPGALPGWFVTTTRRECLRVAKSVRNRNHRERTDIDDLVDTDLPAVDRGLIDAELGEVLRTAFAQLESRCQQLLVLLMRTPPIPYVEISAVMGIPHGAIGPTRARCLAKLRQRPAFARWIRSTAEGGGV